MCLLIDRFLHKTHRYQHSYSHLHYHPIHTNIHIHYDTNTYTLICSNPVSNPSHRIAFSQASSIVLLTSLAFFRPMIVFMTDTHIISPRSLFIPYLSEEGLLSEMSNNLHHPFKYKTKILRCSSCYSAVFKIL